MVIQQTKSFLGHIRNGDETGKLLLSALEYTQIVSGIEKPILHKESETYFLKWTPTTWITDYKKLIRSTQGAVHITNQWRPSLQQKRDKFLMEAFYIFTNDTKLSKY